MAGAGRTLKGLAGARRRERRDRGVRGEGGMMECTSDGGWEVRRWEGEGAGRRRSKGEKGPGGEGIWRCDGIANTPAMADGKWGGGRWGSEAKNHIWCIALDQG